MNLTKAIAKDAADTERQSWEPKESVSYIINVVVNGFGLNREIAERDPARGYSGITETEALAIATKLKRKGFDVQCYKREFKSQRIV